MTLKLRLRAPGGRHRFYYVRGTRNGREREFSTGTTDEAKARQFLIELVAGLDDIDRRRDEEAQRRLPAARPLGAFERWLREEYQLFGETIVRRADHFQPKFHFDGNGYKATHLVYLNWRKRVLEHRFKFLLHHGWLPASIDHLDRDRANNLLSNLAASTPALQIANRRNSVRVAGMISRKPLK